MRNDAVKAGNPARFPFTEVTRYDTQILSTVKPPENVSVRNVVLQRSDSTGLEDSHISNADSNQS